MAKPKATPPNDETWERIAKVRGKLSDRDTWTVLTYWFAAIDTLAEAYMRHDDDTRVWLRLDLAARRIALIAAKKKNLDPVAFHRGHRVYANHMPDAAERARKDRRFRQKGKTGCLPTAYYFRELVDLEPVEEERFDVAFTIWCLLYDELCQRMPEARKLSPKPETRKRVEIAERRQEVAELLADGLSIDEIAADRKVHRSTITRDRDELRRQGRID